MKKKIIILGSIAMILVVIGTIIINQQQDHNVATTNEKIKYNETKEFLRDIKTDTVTITDIKCSYDGNLSRIEYKITNQTNNTLYIGNYEILVKNKNGEIITNINPNLDRNLEAHQSTVVSNEINIDLTNAYKMEFSFDENNKETES